jgi:hypothetical protein
MIQEMEDQVTTLTEEYDKLSDDINELTKENAQLATELSIIQEDYSTLSEDYNKLTENFTELHGIYELLRSEHEELLGDFEASFGGLDINPESIPIIERDYSWDYEFKSQNISLYIPEPLYNYYSSKERYPTNDYSIYVVNPYDDQYLKVITNEFDIIAVENGLTDEEKINLLISFVQDLHYVSDGSTTSFDEYPRFPIETLVEGGGDCEDTSILMASMLRAMNQSVALVYFPYHMGVGIATDGTGAGWNFNGKKYYYLETTALGWSLGQIPEEYEANDAVIYPVADEPFFVIEWEAKRINEKVTVEIRISNESPIKAYGYQPWISLEDVEGNILEEATDTSFDLEFPETKLFVMKMNGPRMSEMRLVLGVQDPEGKIVTKVYSEFFKTR